MGNKVSARHKSAVKRAKQNIKKRERNVQVVSFLKTIVKNVKVAAAGGSKAEAEVALKKAVPVIDKAVSKGVIPRERGSRKIARLHLLVNSVGSVEA